VHTQWIETTFAERIPAEALRLAPDEPGITSSWIEIDGVRHTLRMPAGAGALTGASVLAGAGTPGPAADREPPAGLVAPMAGTFIAWLVEDGAAVAAGDPVAVMEAMKMETTIVADGSGTLRQHSVPGDTLASGEQLATLD